MNNETLEKQGHIWTIFDVMKTIDELEYSFSITDDHNPNVCPMCGGWESTPYKDSESQGMVGHRKDCEFVRLKRKLFQQVVSITDTIPDGNYFLNLAIQLYLKTPIVKCY